MWFLRYASGQTGRQTDRHAYRNTSRPYRGRSNDVGVATLWLKPRQVEKCMADGIAL